jgi:hypothetical protein
MIEARTSPKILYTKSEVFIKQPRPPHIKSAQNERNFESVQYHVLDFTGPRTFAGNAMIPKMRVMSGQKKTFPHLMDLGFERLTFNFEATGLQKGFFSPIFDPFLTGLMDQGVQGLQM